MTEALTLEEMATERVGALTLTKPDELSVALAFAALYKSGLVVKERGIPVSWIVQEAGDYSKTPVSSELVRIIVGRGLPVAGVKAHNPRYSLALQQIDRGAIILSTDERYLRWRPLEENTENFK